MAIIFDRQDAIATITLNRPEVMNALDPQTYAEITEAFEEMERDPAVRVGIITGAGQRAFTAGADLKLMHAGAAEVDDWGPWRPDRWDFGATTSKPLIAAVNGYALAGGLELALVCDIRIASPNAVFGTPEVKWNLLHGYGAYQLPRIISLSHAMELLLTGEFIDADAALRIGLVSRIVPAAELMNEARRLAARIRDNGPMAVRMTKELVRHGLSSSPEDHFRLMREYYRRIDVTPEQAEGLRAFREKRQPDYHEAPS
jgi:E-phenylitaconyl-CoA hydratase